MVNLDEFPFKIHVNRDVAGGRQKIALIHEMLHVGSELYKIPLTEQQIQELAIFIASEILPSVRKFDAAGDVRQGKSY